MNYPTVDQILSKKTFVISFGAANGLLLLVLLLHTSQAIPQLSRLMPGSFHAGVHSTGLWLFLALVLMANVLVVLVIGFAVIFPALLDGVGIDERRVTRLLSENTPISREALQACLAVVHREADIARRRIAVGRSIILASAAGLIFTFAFVCDALVHAPPRKPLFTSNARVVENVTVTDGDVWRFTADQIAGALALDIPELYDFHFGELDNNVRSRTFTDFVFAFRAILGWVALTSIIVTIRDWRSRPDK